MNRTDIINHIIEVKKYSSYLEIGVNDGTNFNKIKCQSKIGIDINPIFKNATYIKHSDDFFKELDENKKFDIIFIDGLHLDFQVDKDIQNSLKHLSNDGTIILHDCNPPSKEYAGLEPIFIPPINGNWNGTVYLSLIKLRLYYDNIQLVTVDTDWGVGIITRGKSKTLDAFPHDSLNWEFFEKHRKEILNLISVEEFKSLYKKK